MSSERVEIPGANGRVLSGRVDCPEGGEAVAWAVFAHCFTCGKDVRAARMIAKALVESGWGVLHFDFTGIGESDGDFQDETFATNLDDLVAASGWLRAQRAAPRLLIGHSWGGAAVIAAAPRIPEVEEVATIGAPSDPGHVRHLFEDQIDEITEKGQARVSLAGRPFTVGKQLLEDLEEQKLERVLNAGGRALLILHSPQDELVPVEHATRLFKHARHPKSFVSLDGADHLLTNPSDADWVGHVIAAWASRRIQRHPADPVGVVDHGVVQVTIGASGYASDIVAGDHTIRADEPERVGGKNTGPTPYDLLLGSLGTCTTMTLRMYADRKKWPLEGVKVSLRHDTDHGGDASHLERKDYHIERSIELQGPLDDQQRARLMEIADRCPVHRTLHGEIVVETKGG